MTSQHYLILFTDSLIYINIHSTKNIFFKSGEILTPLEENAIDISIIEMRCLLKKCHFLLTQKIYVLFFLLLSFFSVYFLILFFRIAFETACTTHVLLFLTWVEWLTGCLPACLPTFLTLHFPAQWWLETYTCTHKHTNTHTHGNNIRIRY